MIFYILVMRVMKQMTKKQIGKGRQAKKKLPEMKEKRMHRVAFMLNDTENNAIERHLRKYKITNKSNWYRRTILAEIWKLLGEDLPLLFPENEMR